MSTIILRAFVGRNNLAGLMAILQFPVLVRCHRRGHAVPQWLRSRCIAVSGRAAPARRRRPCQRLGLHDGDGGTNDYGRGAAGPYLPPRLPAGRDAHRQSIITDTLLNNELTMTTTRKDKTPSKESKASRSAATARSAPTPSNMAALHQVVASIVGEIRQAARCCLPALIAAVSSGRQVGMELPKTDALTDRLEPWVQRDTLCEAGASSSTPTTLNKTE